MRERARSPGTSGRRRALGRHEAVRPRDLELVDEHAAGARASRCRRRRAAASSCRSPRGRAGRRSRRLRRRERRRSARTRRHRTCSTASKCEARGEGRGGAARGGLVAFAAAPKCSSLHDCGLTYSRTCRSKPRATSGLHQRAARLLVLAVLEAAIGPDVVGLASPTRPPGPALPAGSVETSSSSPSSALAVSSSSCKARLPCTTSSLSSSSGSSSGIRAATSVGSGTVKPGGRLPSSRPAALSSARPGRSLIAVETEVGEEQLRSCRR